MNNLKAMTNPQLFGRIEELMENVDSNMFDICTMLSEMRSRGMRHQDHPLFNHRLFRYYQSITAGIITPALVIVFNGDKGKIAKFSGYKKQIMKLASDGAPFAVAVLNKKTGNIFEKDKSVAEMSPAEINRVFIGGNETASFLEQKFALKAEIEAKKAAIPTQRIRVNNENSIKVENKLVTLDELKAVLAELGYNIVKN